ncbi:1-propanol dehydrogenase PduQ [Robertmurraya sp. FSL W8-0741]|uniref:1-propanol dehydrogenase PduQ n=1 Tax=Robertmurraya TaxID=2837507 RepID=UPI000BA66E68|nr:1-propanol dehydrogenase PduQ [Robertmurraya siralis]PAE19335.1 alcohol dehydrogenase [Bacillus sp. 7504-2]
MKEFYLPTKIFMGDDALDRLEQLTNENIFLITDPFIEKSGMLDEVLARMKGRNNDFEVFSEIVPDPPIETVVSGVKVIEELNPGVIIAFGGGSTIDAAKAIKDFAIKLSILKTEPKLIAIPTTSGTGTEVTSFSVITDQEKQLKYPIVSDSLLPQEAILAPNLVKSVPPAITADTGMDVLTHGIEAYVSINATDFSDAFAEKAIQLIFEYLPRAYKNGEDLEAREKVHHASCLAGIAFNIAGLGINHSIAHASGAHFHIPHGRMNSLLLTTVIEFNADIQDFSNRHYSNAAKKYAKLAKILGLSSTNCRIGVKNLNQHIRLLQKELDMPTSLRQCGVTYDQVVKEKRVISEAALIDACTKTNCKIPAIEDLEKIIESIK